MTLNNPENKAAVPLPQEKVDSSVAPQNVDVGVPKEAVNEIKQQESQQQPNTPETPEDPNWKAFREARKRDRAEREAAEKRAVEKEAEVAALKAAMEAAFAKGSPSPAPVQNQYGYPEEESEDQRIEKKVQAAIAAKEAQYQREAQQREAREYPMRLQQNYPDFNQTISQENLDYLDYHYPEVSRPLQRLPEGYDRWVDIYHAVKKFVPNHNQAKKEAARADANFVKPKSMSTTGITQSQAAPGSHILSEDKKASNWARMQQTLKGVG